MMRKLFLFVPAALLLTCAMALAQQQGAQHETITETFSEFIPCLNDTLDFSVTINETLQESPDMTHLNVHAVISGTAVSETTGTSYAVHGTENQVLNLTHTDTGGGEATETISLKFLAQGQTPNLVIQIVEHITVDPNGNITVDFTRGDTSCLS